jgi:rhodanese-related sulfurtransferase
MNFCSININKKLALFVVIIGFLAIFGGNPQSKSRMVVDTKELAAQMTSKSNYISVFNLADKIIKAEADFRLIDMRNEANYNEYNIPGSENILISDFNESDMPRNEKYYLISDSDILTGQAWSLLKTRGYTAVYVIEGGLNEWKKSILFPALPANADAKQKAKFDKMVEVCKFFGGQPQTGVENASENVNISMPKPSSSQPVKVKKTGKGKKEGC